MMYGYGNFFMMGFGMLMMMVVVTLRIVLIGVLVWALIRKGSPANQAPAVPFTPVNAGRACTHCGAALQPGWTHCPQCGSPIS